jgi:hypothetical protein
VLLKKGGGTTIGISLFGQLIHGIKSMKELKDLIEVK